MENLFSTRLIMFDCGTSRWITNQSNLIYICYWWWCSRSQVIGEELIWERTKSTVRIVTIHSRQNYRHGWWCMAVKQWYYCSSPRSSFRVLCDCVRGLNFLITGKKQLQNRLLPVKVKQVTQIVNSHFWQLFFCQLFALFFYRQTKKKRTTTIAHHHIIPIRQAT